MNELIEFGPGFPEWTELGQESGLDPLGMQRPIEVIYQGLMPGISTITLRLRYYSFFAWLLEAYAKQVGINELAGFRLFQRRAEALLALVCARGRTELGVTGIDWATKRLKEFEPNPSLDTVVDFMIGADAESPVEKRYLRNKGGAFGAIYSSQMWDMGLVELADKTVKVPFCKDAALPLATGFGEALGDLEDLFLKIVERGTVTLGQLDTLAPVQPSLIAAGGEECEALAATLMGRHQDARKSDNLRRHSLQLLLNLAYEVGHPPTVDEAKWSWFDFAKPGDERLLPTREAWALYQTSDLCRLAYETLLDACLITVQNAPGSLASVEGTASTVAALASASAETSFGELLIVDGGPGECQIAANLMLEAAAAGDTAGQVESAFALLACLYRKHVEFSAETLRWLNAADHFQSLATEVRYFDTLLNLPAVSAVEMIVTERVLRRHLWVASRKFRNQKAYTFLVEPDEGMLRYRESFRISPSSPRLTQAVQFLRDAHLIDDKGLTTLGQAERAAA